MCTQNLFAQIERTSTCLQIFESEEVNEKNANYFCELTRENAQVLESLGADITHKTLNGIVDAHGNKWYIFRVLWHQKQELEKYL